MHLQFSLIFAQNVYWAVRTVYNVQKVTLGPRIFENKKVYFFKQECTIYDRVGDMVSDWFANW